MITNLIEELDFESKEDVLDFLKELENFRVPLSDVLKINNKPVIILKDNCLYTKDMCFICNMHNMLDVEKVRLTNGFMVIPYGS